MTKTILWSRTITSLEAMHESAASGVFSDAILLDLVENSAEAALAVDSALRIVAWNGGAEGLTGYRAPEVLGRHCSEIIQGVYDEGYPMCVAGCEGTHCFSSGNMFATNCYIRSRHGVSVHVAMRTISVPAQSDREVGNHVAATIYLAKKKAAGPHDADSGEQVRIYALGRFGLVKHGFAVATDNWGRKQALALLKLLVSHAGRPLHRDLITEALWPDANEDSARERLKVTVYGLRKALRDAEISDQLIQTVGSAYVLHSELVWLDTIAFEQCIELAIREKAAGRLETALHAFDEARVLYRGDYMEEDIRVCFFDEERQRLHEMYLEVLLHMAECHEALGDCRSAVSTCRSLLVEDPCREDVHRMLMSLLEKMGHSSSALGQYRQCRVILARELAVDPMPATQALYREILRKQSE